MISSFWFTMHYKLFACLIICCVPSALSINCWSCRSNRVSKGCDDPFKNTSVYLKDCNDVEAAHYPGLSPTLCRKVKYKVKGEWYIHRDCAFIHDPESGDGHSCMIQENADDNKYVEYCTCFEKDGCNAGNKLWNNLIMPMVLFLSVLAYWIWKQP